MKDASQDNESGGRYTEGLSSDESYKPYKTVWANISTVNARESFEHNRSIADVSHEITIRYRKDITRDDIIRYQDRLFRIDYILNVNEAKRFLQILAKEET